MSAQWKGKWYDAAVLQSWEGLHLVRYAGFGPEWNEWVAPERVRSRR